MKQRFEAGEAIAWVSHELKNCMSAIQGYAQLLARPDELNQDKRREYVRIILNRCRAAQSLMDDLAEAQSEGLPDAKIPEKSNSDSTPITYAEATLSIEAGKNVKMKFNQNSTKVPHGCNLVSPYYKHEGTDCSYGSAGGNANGK